MCIRDSLARMRPAKDENNSLVVELLNQVSDETDLLSAMGKERSGEQEYLARVRARGARPKCKSRSKPMLESSSKTKGHFEAKCTVKENGTVKKKGTIKEKGSFTLALRPGVGTPTPAAPPPAPTEPFPGKFAVSYTHLTLPTKRIV